jgi:transcriptional regulator with XRE-family HTH domain
MGTMTPFERKRLAAGLTRQAIADKFGITARAVGKWATGEAKPSPEYFPKLAKLLRISRDEVVDLFDRQATSAAA